MNDSCDIFRAAWLERALDERTPASAHASECDACATWVQRRRRVVEALLGMPRLEVPDSFDWVVGSELADRNTRLLERALRSVEPLEAPTELEARVDALLRAAAAEPRSGVAHRDPDAPVKSLGSLDYSTVPPVLERLIDEELHEPAAHVVDRFVGNLTRMIAPAELELRVARYLRRPTLPRISRWITAAAAVLVVWLIVRGPEETPADSAAPRRLVVVRASNLGELDPLARGMLMGLGGVEPLRSTGPEEKR